MRNLEFYKRFHIWRINNLSLSTLMVISSIVVGLVSGLAGVVLKSLVHYTNQWVMNSDFAEVIGGNAAMLILPAIGIALTILFVQRIIKGEIGHGIPSVLLSISRNEGRLPVSNTYSSMIASTLTVAFGGSVGLEAPIASTGSAIGSNIGRLLHLSPKHVKLLLGCGAAGAIAGIFKAPLAGILFVVEVLLFDMTSTTGILLLLSSISGSIVAYFLMGQNVQFAFTIQEHFELNQIPYYIGLGLFCAIASVYFLRTTDHVEAWFAKRKSRITKWMVGGLTLGVLIFLFPPLFGEGYGALTQLLHNNDDILFANSIFDSFKDNPWALLVMLLALLVFKPVATATTIGSGGVGGTFGPSLIMGGLCGYFFAMLSNQMGLPTQSAANFALVGMAGVMTGVMHAPLMATFLITEITGGYSLMSPLLLTVAVTFLCVSPFEKHSIYARKLAQKGDLLTHDKDSSAWQLMDMQKLIETNFVVVRQGDHLRQLVQAIKTSRRNVFPILDDLDHLTGVIHLDDVRAVMFRQELYDLYLVDDLARPLSEGDIVRGSDTLQDVVQKFRVNDRYNLIVVDENDAYVGFISRANTFSAYRKFISDSSDE